MQYVAQCIRVEILEVLFSLPVSCPAHKDLPSCFEEELQIKPRGDRKLISQRWQFPHSAGMKENAARRPELPGVEISSSREDNLKAAKPNSRPPSKQTQKGFDRKELFYAI